MGTGREKLGRNHIGTKTHQEENPKKALRSAVAQRGVAPEAANRTGKGGNIAQAE